MGNCVKVEVTGRRFTSKICPIAELNLLTAAWDHSDGAMLDEVHFPTQSSFSYYHVSRLEDLETQLGEDHCHKMRVGVGKQWHVGHEPAAVITNDLLHGGEKEKKTFRNSH